MPLPLCKYLTMSFPSMKADKKAFLWGYNLAFV